MIAYALLGLIVLAFVPLSETYTDDISSDGSHLLKLVYSEGYSYVYIDDRRFNASEGYSIDGNGTHIFLLSFSSIYVYSYSGELIEEIPLNVSQYEQPYRIARHNGFYIAERYQDYCLIKGPQGVLYNSSNYVLDIDYGTHLIALVSQESSRSESSIATVLYYDDGVRKTLGSVVNGSYIAAFGGIIKVYDSEGNVKGTFSLVKPSLQPKPVSDLSPNEVVEASTGATAGYLALLYYIRQRQLTSLANLRRLAKRKFDYRLVLPLVGWLIEEIVAPYKDPLTLLVILAISIGGGYAIYALIKREFSGKLKYLRIALSLYGAVFSFIGLIKLTRRRSVVIFYALSAAYALIERFYLKNSS